MRYLERSAAFVITAILSLVVLLILSVGLWAAPPREFTISRDTLVSGDPMRDWCYLWIAEGGARGAVTLTGQQGTVAALPLLAEHKPPINDELDLRNGFCLPPNIKAGSYRVNVAGVDTGLSVNVSRVSSRQTILLHPSPNPADNLVNIKLNSGPRTDVILAPGLWRLNGRLDLQRGSSLTGPGAVICWQWPERFNGTLYHLNGMLWGDDCTFSRLTFDLSGSGFLSWNGNGAGTVFHQCQFMHGSLGNWNQFNSLVWGCRFVSASAGSVAGGTWFDCDWERLCYTGHAFAAEQGHRLAVLHCRWQDTDRGVLLRFGWGPQHRTYCSHLAFGRVSWVDNGMELIGTEGPVHLPALEACVFYRVRSTGCRGQVNFWEGHVRRCRLIDFDCDDTLIQFYAAGGACDQSDNTIERCELRGQGILFWEGAKRNKCIQVSVIGPRPTRANQLSVPHESSTMGIAAKRQAGYDPAFDADANSVKDCKVSGAKQGEDFVNVKR